MSTALSLITTCKGRLQYLQQTLPSMVAQAGTECIVVDYGCPQGTAQWVAENFPAVRIVKVDDDPGFNQCRARNLGAVAARSAIFCFVDADINLDPQFGSWISENCTSNTFLRAKPVTMDTWGTFSCRREDFWGVGGYDEVYQGYGVSPEDLYLRLAFAGGIERGFPASLISSIPNTETERTAFYSTTNRWWQHRINSLYLIAKLDLMKLLGTDLSSEQKEALYTQSRQAIQQAMNSSANTATLDVTLEDETTRTMNVLLRLDRKLIYSIRWTSHTP
jgi:hypothetical protein